MRMKRARRPHEKEMDKQNQNIFSYKQENIVVAPIQVNGSHHRNLGDYAIVYI